MAAHIGNGWAIVVFDVAYRLLREIYGAHDARAHNIALIHAPVG